MLWNGTDQRHLDLQGNPTSSTKLTNNSHSVTLPMFSDYNTLGERDYEVIDIPDHSKNEYHRLQRPSLPNGRPSQASSLPNGKIFSRMQSMTSTNSTQQMSGFVTREGMVLGRDTSTSKSDRRVCKSLDMPEENSADFPYSPPSASSPDILRQFSRNDSSTHLLPHSTSRPMDTLRSNANESLYSPTNPLLQHALQGVPETGTMFPEPSEPSEFPVHVYECIPGAQACYETPVPSKKSSAASLAVPVGTLQSTASEADYPDSTADYTGTGEAVVDFPVTTLSSDYYPKSSTGDFTGDSQYSDTLGFMTDFTGASADIFYPTSKSLPDFTDVTEFTVEARSSTLGRTLLSEEPDRTDSSDFTGPIPLYHVLEQNNSHLQHSHYRPHPYKKLDPSTMAPVLTYTKLKLGKNTAV